MPHTTDDLSHIRTQLHDALTLWHKDSAAGNPLGDFALFHRARHQTDNDRQATNRVLTEVLDILNLSYPSEAALLRERYLEERSVHIVANRLSVSQSTVYGLQRTALEHLAEVVLRLERKVTQSLWDHAEQRLPLASYAALVGVEPQLHSLQTLLLTSGGPWIVALEGMGGLGKTSLADAVVRRIVRSGNVEEVAWISAQRSFFDGVGRLQREDQPALTIDGLVQQLGTQLLGRAFASALLNAEEAFGVVRAHLKERTHLIVVDNLETMVDVEALVPTLRRLVTPSKFLLTSRYHLTAHGHVRSITVPALSESATLTLIRQEAGLTSQVDLQEAPDDVLRSIYQTVGGNPLAVRLVVGQTYVHGLNLVLEDLRGARGQSVGELYAYLYRNAWERLDEEARRVWLAMPLLSEAGGDSALVVGTSQLPLDIVRRGLEHLVRLNLVEVRGDLSSRVYSIHSLTRTFLHHQIVQWK